MVLLHKNMLHFPIPNEIRQWVDFVKLLLDISIVWA